jgi:starch phosphorylase
MPTSTLKRTAADSPAEIMRSLIQRHLTSTLARYAPSATPRDWWIASSLAVRDTILERMIATQGVHNAENGRIAWRPGSTTRSGTPWPR